MPVRDDGAVERDEQPAIRDEPLQFRDMGRLDASLTPPWLQRIQEEARLAHLLRPRPVDILRIKAVA